MQMMDWEYTDLFAEKLRRLQYGLPQLNVHSTPKTRLAVEQNRHLRVFNSIAESLNDQKDGLSQAFVLDLQGLAMEFISVCNTDEELAEMLVLFDQMVSSYQLRSYDRQPLPEFDAYFKRRFSGPMNTLLIAIRDNGMRLTRLAEDAWEVLADWNDWPDDSMPSQNSVLMDDVKGKGKEREDSLFSYKSSAFNALHRRPKVKNLRGTAEERASGPVIRRQQRFTDLGSQIVRSPRASDASNRSSLPNRAERAGTSRSGSDHWAKLGAGSLPVAAEDELDDGLEDELEAELALLVNKPLLTARPVDDRLANAFAGGRRWPFYPGEAYLDNTPQAKALYDIEAKNQHMFSIRGDHNPEPGPRGRCGSNEEYIARLKALDFATAPPPPPPTAAEEVPPRRSSRGTRPFPRLSDSIHTPSPRSTRSSTRKAAAAASGAGMSARPPPRQSRFTENFPPASIVLSPRGIRKSTLPRSRKGRKKADRKKDLGDLLKRTFGLR